MRGKKRVRFKVSGAHHSSVSNFDGTSIPSGSADASGLADPKTSEFAFFKKLKRDASMQFHPSDQHTETKQFKNCKSTNNVGDMNKMKYENFKSMPHAKEAVPADPIFLPSQQASAFCSPDKTREVANCLAFEPLSARNSPVSDHLHSPISSYFDPDVTEDMIWSLCSCVGFSQRVLKIWILSVVNSQPSLNASRSHILTQVLCYMETMVHPEILVQLKVVGSWMMILLFRALLNSERPPLLHL